MTLNPNESFVINSINRSQIAEVLNDTDCTLNLAPDDIRLTREFCGAFAVEQDTIGDFAEDGRTEDEIAIFRESINAHFVAVLTTARGLDDFDLDD